MKYAIANKDMCLATGIDITRYRIVDNMVIMNENDLMQLGDTAERAASRLGCVPISSDEARAWIKEHTKNIIRQ